MNNEIFSNIRDLIDSIMTGIIIGNLDFWILDNQFERVVLIASIAVLAYMSILQFKRA